MSLLDTLYQQTQNSLIYDLGYDLFKIILGFIFAKFFYDKVIMELRWGGREVSVRNGEDILATRNLSPDVAKRIETDATDFSVYIKGLVSPFTWLNIDVSSKEAEELGLVYKQGNHVIIDISKNPKEEVPIDTVNISIQNRLDRIMESLGELQTAMPIDLKLEEK